MNASKDRKSHDNQDQQPEDQSVSARSDISDNSADGDDSRTKSSKSNSSEGQAGVPSSESKLSDDQDEGNKLRVDKDAVEDDDGNQASISDLTFNVRFAGRKEDDDENEDYDEDYEEEDKPCQMFTGVYDYAEYFVDDIINEAVGVVDRRSGSKMGEFEENLEAEQLSISDERYYVEDDFFTFEGWPAIKDFDAEVGGIAIDDYVYTWNFEENWLYAIDYLGERSDICSDHYNYEVKFSIPSNPYPVAQATASVFFTIEVSRVKPDYCPVSVFYRFEGQRLIHTPGKYGFNEVWLFYIVESKLKLFKTLKC